MIRMVSRVEAPDYQADFARLEKTLPGGSRLVQLRRAAFERFASTGFPSVRDEAWRFTNVAAIAGTPFQPAVPGAEGSVSRRDLAEVLLGTGVELVFVNGFFAPALSSSRLPAGVAAGNFAASPDRLNPLEESLGTVFQVPETPFAALNMAFFADGAWVRIGPKAVVKEPIHLVFVSLTGPGPDPRPLAIHPRTFLLVEEGGQAQVVSSHIGLPSPAGEAEGPTRLVNAAVEISLSESAVFTHTLLQQEGAGAFHVSCCGARLARGAQFTSRVASVDSRFVRNDLSVLLGGEGAGCTLDGLFLTRLSEHVDNHTSIDHAAPHTSSRELYKGVLDGSSTGVFNGRITVRPGAQKTDARQASRNLLLSEEALVSTNPQLQIDADDVKCSHGATVGQLDEEAVFYLRSRGIGLAEARNLVILAFAEEVIGRIEPAPLRARLEETLKSHLPAATGALA